MKHKVDAKVMESMIEDIISSHLSIRDVPYYGGEDTIKEVDPTSIQSAAQDIVKLLRRKEI